MKREQRVLALGDISTYRNELYGIAILWIMLFHGVEWFDFRVFEQFAFLTPIHTGLSYGNMGCEIFLFCSGVCLYFSFFKNRDYMEFLKNRLLRLFLPVLLIDGWYWVFVDLIQKRSLFSFVNHTSLMAFWDTGDQQVWFVSLILVCYFLYPYLYGFLFPEKEHAWRQTLLRYVFLMILVGLLTLALRECAPNLYDNIEIGITRFPIFITGGLFGKLVYEKKEGPWWLYLFLLGLAVMTFVGLNMHLFHGVWRRWWYFFGGVALVFLVPLGLKFLHCKPLDRVLAFFGTLSLNLYLVHILLIRRICDKMLNLNLSRFWQYLILMGICVLLAWLAEMLIGWLRKRISMRDY